MTVAEGLFAVLDLARHILDDSHVFKRGVGNDFGRHIDGPDVDDAYDFPLLFFHCYAPLFLHCLE